MTAGKHWEQSLGPKFTPQSREQWTSSNRLIRGKGRQRSKPGSLSKSADMSTKDTRREVKVRARVQKTSRMKTKGAQKQTNMLCRRVLQSTGDNWTHQSGADNETTERDIKVVTGRNLIPDETQVGTEPSK